MLNIGEGFPPQSTDSIIGSLRNVDVSKNDILNEIKTTNEILREMRDIMYQMYIDIKNTNKLLIETYNKMGESQK